MRHAQLPTRGSHKTTATTAGNGGTTTTTTSHDRGASAHPANCTNPDHARPSSGKKDRAESPQRRNQPTTPQRCHHHRQSRVPHTRASHGSPAKPASPSSGSNNSKHYGRSRDATVAKQAGRVATVTRETTGRSNPIHIQARARPPTTATTTNHERRHCNSLAPKPRRNYYNTAGKRQRQRGGQPTMVDPGASCHEVKKPTGETGGGHLPGPAE